MPRPPTANHWIEEIRHQRANFPGKSALAVARELREVELSDDPAPGEKTVRKYFTEFDDLSAEEQEQYRAVHWPESFARGLLPWEASESVLELMSHSTESETGDLVRPSIRWASWYWRITQALPDWPAAARRYLLFRFGCIELLPVFSASGSRRPDQPFRDLEAFILKVIGTGKLPPPPPSDTVGARSRSDGLRWPTYGYYRIFPPDTSILRNLVTVCGIDSMEDPFWFDDRGGARGFIPAPDASALEKGEGHGT